MIVKREDQGAYLNTLNKTNTDPISVIINTITMTASAQGFTASTAARLTISTKLTIFLFNLPPYFFKILIFINLT